MKIFGKLPVIGGRDCQSATKKPAHGEVFKIGDRISVTALHTPCHTQDSVCYFMQDGDQRVVFTGDTLFIGGILPFSPPGSFGDLQFVVLRLLTENVSVSRMRPFL